LRNWAKRWKVEKRNKRPRQANGDKDKKRDDKHKTAICASCGKIVVLDLGSMLTYCNCGSKVIAAS
jgi:hypothetical protein